MSEEIPMGTVLRLMQEGHITHDDATKVLSDDRVREARLFLAQVSHGSTTLALIAANTPSRWGAVLWSATLACSLFAVRSAVAWWRLRRERAAAVARVRAAMEREGAR